MPFPDGRGRKFSPFPNVAGRLSLCVPDVAVRDEIVPFTTPTAQEYRHALPIVRLAASRLDQDARIGTNLKHINIGKGTSSLVRFIIGSTRL